jgi:hypothetical protein
MTEEKRGPGRPPKQDVFAAVVLRDYWTESGDRIRKGQVVEVAPMQMIEGLELGTLARVK